MEPKWHQNSSTRGDELRTSKQLPRGSYFGSLFFLSTCTKIFWQCSQCDLIKKTFWCGGNEVLNFGSMWMGYIKYTSLYGWSLKLFTHISFSHTKCGKKFTESRWNVNSKKSSVNKMLNFIPMYHCLVFPHLDVDSSNMTKAAAAAAKINELIHKMSLFYTQQWQAQTTSINVNFPMLYPLISFPYLAIYSSAYLKHIWLI